MSIEDIERLRSIKSFPSLVKYLRDELDWPIASEDFDELTFDYEPEELGLDAKTASRSKRSSNSAHWPRTSPEESSSSTLSLSAFPSWCSAAFCAH